VEKKSMKKTSGKRAAGGGGAGGGGGRGGGADRREKKTDVGYLRVIAIKKEKESLSNISKKYETIPESSGSSSIMHLFSGEKKEVSDGRISSILTRR
jgi:hypothetical protein